MKDKNMSPLRYFTIMQTEKLKEKNKDDKLLIDYAMRSGSAIIFD